MNFNEQVDNIIVWFSFNRGAIPGSINMPYTTSFSQDGNSLVQTSELSVLKANVGKIIVVVGNRGDSAVKVKTTITTRKITFKSTNRNTSNLTSVRYFFQFAEKILRLEFPKVCVLHRGIDIFRSSNILIVPSSV